jgi:tRNA A-37 threonylcarbamoyl transferase component Bud32
MTRDQGQGTKDDLPFGPGGFRLHEWLAQGAAGVVKQGAGRTVYRVELPGRDAFYVKHYRARSWRDVARTLARGSPARREWRKMCEAARRGLPAAVPLAFHEVRRGLFVRESLLATLAIDDAPSLLEVLASLPSRPPAEAERLRRALANELAALCATCHAAGARQTDLHAGNILVRLPAGDARLQTSGFGLQVKGPSVGPEPRSLKPEACRLYLIDLPTVRFSRPLGWRASRDNLAVLCAVLSRHATLRDRWRFWRRYLAARDDLRLPSPRDAALEIFRRAWAHCRRVARSRDRRCWRSNRDFRRVDTPHGRVYAAADVPPEHVAALANDPEGPLRAFRHRPAKLSHPSVVVQAELPTTAGRMTVAYKRSRPKHWWKAPLAWLRTPRALAAWRLAHALLVRGIATARPLLVHQSKRRGQGYLASQWLDGAEDLHLYGWRLATLSPPERFLRARRCLESLGRLIGHMHAWDVSHRDLKAVNLAAVERERQTDVYLLDLDGVRLARRLSDSTRVRNLARMAASLRLHPWVSRTLVLRLLRAYLQALGGSRAAWKPLWRDVADACRQMTAHRERRGRMVA